MLEPNQIVLHEESHNAYNNEGSARVADLGTRCLRRYAGILGGMMAEFGSHVKLQWSSTAQLARR